MLKRVVPPSAEPVSAAEAFAHQVLEDQEEETLVEGYLRAARELVEARLNQSLVSSTWEQTYADFPRRFGEAIRPEVGPLVSVESIAYRDAAGAYQALDPALYDVEPGPAGYVARAPQRAWPCLAIRPGAVRVRYVAGYGAPADVPEAAKLAIKMLAATWYETREAVVIGVVPAKLEFAVDSLLATLDPGNYV